MSREGGGRLDGCAVQPAEERGGEARVAAAREEARAAVAVVREAPERQPRDRHLRAPRAVGLAGWTALAACESIALDSPRCESIALDSPRWIWRGLDGSRRGWRARRHLGWHEPRREIVESFLGQHHHRCTSSAVAPGPARPLPLRPRPRRAAPALRAPRAPAPAARTAALRSTDKVRGGGPPQGGVRAGRQGGRGVGAPPAPRLALACRGTRARPRRRQPRSALWTRRVRLVREEGRDVSG